MVVALVSPVIFVRVLKLISFPILLIAKYAVSLSGLSASLYRVIMSLYRIFSYTFCKYSSFFVCKYSGNPPSCRYWLKSLFSLLLSIDVYILWLILVPLKTKYSLKEKGNSFRGIEAQLKGTEFEVSNSTAQSIYANQKEGKPLGVLAKLRLETKEKRK